MLIEFRLPQFGMGMTDGTILGWRKQPGDAVAKDEPLLDVEAAKTDIEIGSPVDGVLAQILVAAKENVPVQTVIAMIETQDALAPGASPPAGDAQTAPAVDGMRSKATPLARRAADINGVDLDSLQGSGPGGRICRNDVHGAAEAGMPQQAGAADAVQVEPRARRAAKELGMDLKMVKGTGPAGRIVEADVRSSTKAAPPPAPPSAPPSAPAPAQQQAAAATPQAVPHSKMRQIIAQRLTQSKQTVPHFYLTAHCEIDALLAARARINAAFPGENVSVNAFVIKAVACALDKVPAANVSWTEAEMLHHSTVDIAMAVATDGGLITPIVRAAQAKTLRAIGAETKDLAARARNGGLSPREYKGGSVSVSNLGMFGVEEFSAIINPPHSCIFAVGAGMEKPVARHGALAVATVMTVTLSVDHRAVDGSVAGQLLSAFKSFIEEPLSLMA